MEDRIKNALEFAEIHKKARIAANRSQEYMALCLGVSKKTISNWEKGLSSPTFFQSLEWFKILNINPFPVYLKLAYPNATIDNTDIDSAFDELASSFTKETKMALMYFFLGEHGSAPNALIQLFLAHLHCPLKTRLTQATLIYHDYEIEHKIGETICKSDIQPNMEVLGKAIQKAYESTLHKEYGYNNLE